MYFLMVRKSQLLILRDVFVPKSSDYLCFSCLPGVAQLHTHYYDVISNPQDHTVKLFLISMRNQ